MNSARVRILGSRRSVQVGALGLLATTSLLARTAGAQTGQGVPPAAPPDVATTAMVVPDDLLHLAPGGLTSDQVGRRAAATSFTVKQNEESLKAAAARVDESWQAFLPKLRVSGALYLTDITNPPSLGTVVIDKAGPGTVTPIEVSGGKLSAISLALPSTLGAYLLQATISVPISDYFLRIGQNHAAATDSADAARYDLVGQRATSEANGRVAYYTWLRARGAVLVTILALNDQRTHLALAKNQYAVGRASRADVLRAETDVASAELSLEQAKNLAGLSEKQVRVAMHAKDDEVLLPGESLETLPPAMGGTLRSMEDEAVDRRAEVKSVAANAASLREQSKAIRNGGYPSLSASGNGIAANTDAGSLGPTSTWIGVWYVGAQVSWSPNELGTQASAAADVSHRAAALDAQMQQMKDNIEVEVTCPWRPRSASSRAPRRGTASPRSCSTTVARPRASSRTRRRI
jgi:outer membrane protein TolC